MAAGSRGRTAPESTNMRASPGAHLRAELRRLGLDQVAVSKATGVSRQSVNNIVNGRQPISRAMAGKLGRLTGHSSDYWLGEWFGENGAPMRDAVSGILVNHQIARAVRDGVIVIEPFVLAHLRTASLDLTLGEPAVRIGGKPSPKRKDTVALKPGGTLSVTTAERIELPLDYLGRIGGLAQLAAAGLVLAAPLQVAPGFKGALSFALLNAGPRTITLRAGEPVATLEIVRLAAAAETA
jgi:deoxycytidine triphosphate deaminase/addiction module HigA family antidote